MGEEGEASPRVAKKASGLSYAFYYVILFFAYWFGSRRWDLDSSGDFDPEDVQAYLADKGILSRNARRSAAKRHRDTERIAKATKSSRSIPSPKSSRSMKSGQTQNSVSDAGVDATSTGGLGANDVDGTPSAAAAEANTSKSILSEEAIPKVTSQSSFSGLAAEEKPSAWVVQPHNNQDVPSFRMTVDSLEEDEHHEANAAGDDFLASLSQYPPLYLMLQCALVFLLWIIGSVIVGADTLMENTAGLDSMVGEGSTNLRLADENCEDLRAQVWRWILYQFTHNGGMHVVMNCLLTIVCGISIEGHRGHFKTAVMFQLGVLGGACFWFIYDAHVPAVGISGGAYAMVGIQIADLFMNCANKKFRIMTVLFILVLVGLDFVTLLFGQKEETFTYAPQIGGVIVGLFYGAVIVRRTRLKVYHWILQTICLSVGIGFVAFAIASIFMQETGPQSFLESMEGTNGWCWTRQMLDPSVDEYNWLCIRCGDKACIEEWGGKGWPVQYRPVLLSECASGWHVHER